jgi:hypothetical protein
MDVGMLWFDNDKNADLNTKVKRAATYYQKKYGQTPNLCFVHPSMLSENGSGSENGKAHKAGEVEIRSSISLLPNHFWLGVNQG